MPRTQSKAADATDVKIWPRPQTFGLGFDLGLVALASASSFWPRLPSLADAIGLAHGQFLLH